MKILPLKIMVSAQGPNISETFTFCTAETFCVATASLALIPLVWLRSLEKLAASALLANASILFGIGIAFIQKR